MRWRALLVVVLLVHALALYLPGSPSDTPGIPGLDKVVHVLLFAVPVYIVGRITPSLWPILLLIAHAPVSELVQWRFIPYRSGDLFDLVADLFGVTLGWWLARRTEPARDPST